MTTEQTPPKPGRRLSKRNIHGNLDGRRYILEPAVVNPVLGGIAGEREFLNAVFVDVVVELE